jgi:hypothetical protein
MSRASLPVSKRQRPWWCCGSSCRQGREQWAERGGCWLGGVGPCGRRQSRGTCKLAGMGWCPDSGALRHGNPYLPEKQPGDRTRHWLSPWPETRVERIPGSARACEVNVPDRFSRLIGNSGNLATLLGRLETYPVSFRTHWGFSNVRGYSIEVPPLSTVATASAKSIMYTAILPPLQRGARKPFC